MECAQWIYKNTKTANNYKWFSKIMRMWEESWNFLKIWQTACRFLCFSTQNERTDETHKTAWRPQETLDWCQNRYGNLTMEALRKIMDTALTPSGQEELWKVGLRWPCLVDWNDAGEKAGEINHLNKTSSAFSLMILNHKKNAETYELLIYSMT